MAHRPAGPVLRHLYTLAGAASDAEAPDAELLRRFAARRDEAAFAALVRRHGPMVLRVARGALADPHAAEDVFQAAFLALARSPGAIRKGASLGCWLHGVARRLALKVRADERKRRTRQPPPPAAEADPLDRL